MAAPTVVRTHLGGFESSTWNLTLTDGITGGNSVLVLYIQNGTTIRTVSSISDGSGNTYSQIARRDEATGFGAVAIYLCASASAVSAGGTLSFALSGFAGGALFTIETSPVTSASLNDSYLRTTGSGSHQCGATGLTTSGDVIVVGCGCHSGDSHGFTGGDGYTLPYTGSAPFVGLYKASASGLSATVAPWTTVATNRSCLGVMAAFYDAAAPAGQPTMRRWGATPFVGGRGVNHAGGNSGRMWGRSDSGLYVPRRLAA